MNTDAFLATSEHSLLVENLRICGSNLKVLININDRCFKDHRHVVELLETCDPASQAHHGGHGLP